MAQWLRRIVGKSEDGLPELLKSYPAYLGPFPGAGHALLPEQAAANLSFLLANRQARLAAVLGLLAARGVGTNDALGQGDPLPFLDRLWKWIEAEWPTIHSKQLARTYACRNPRGDGIEKALSLVMDVGILAGEVVLERRPGFGWALDLDPENQGIEDGVRSQKQPVVFRAGKRPIGDILYDPVGVMETVYKQCKDDPGMFLLNRLADGVTDIVSGTAEREAAERERAWQ